jgi:ABC-type transport system involved in cytochrome bd biosynthesis fused ATPase/permease subunit
VRYGDRVLGSADSAARARGEPRCGVGPNERPFAWVPQHAPVVADTLAVNVSLGCADAEGDADPEAILDELGAAGLAESIGDRVLGRSRPLSGGERQWIAVARALAAGLPVLLRRARRDSRR